MLLLQHAAAVQELLVVERVSGLVLELEQALAVGVFLALGLRQEGELVVVEGLGVGDVLVEGWVGGGGHGSVGGC